MHEKLYLYLEDDRLVDLWILYKEGIISAAEKQQLDLLLEQPENAGVYEFLASWKGEEEELHLSENDKEEAWQKILEATRPVITMPARRRNYRWIVAVAALVAGITALIFLLYRNSDNSDNKPMMVQERLNRNDKPTKNTAVLTLPDGKQLMVSDTLSGVVYKESNFTVISNLGMLSIHPAGNTSAIYEKKILSFTTGKASKFAVLLPDGSRIYLSALSTLAFPVAFADARREVTTSGLVDFDIAPRSGQPFTVITGKQKVSVLGTHFMICSYENGPAVTTLLQGSIAVSIGSTTRQLHPGQQSVVTGSSLEIISNVDTAQLLKWKTDEKFSFTNSDVPEVLETLGNFYGVHIYTTNRRLLKGKLTGEFAHHNKLEVSIDELCQILHATSVLDTANHKVLLR